MQEKLDTVKYFGPIVVSCIRRTALAFIDVNHPNGNVVKAPRVLAIA